MSSDWFSEKTKKRLDAETEKWLAENDPLYGDWRGRSKMSHPYLTERQMQERRKKEIPTDPRGIDEMGDRF